MTGMVTWRLRVALMTLTATAVAWPVLPAPEALRWLAPTREARPWTRWWWLGSAVDRENLGRMLVQFEQAGLGGVEICPIYGVKGYEARSLPFLSPRWMDVLAFTTLEADRLGLGVDLTTGTGWLFGGPGVVPEDASSALVIRTQELAGCAPLGEGLLEGQPLCVLAVSGSGERRDLAADVRPDGRLDWVAPEGDIPKSARSSLPRLNAAV